MQFFVTCGLLIVGLALYADARPASAGKKLSIFYLKKFTIINKYFIDVAQKFDPNAFGKSTFKSRKLISEKRPDKMESQDDAVSTYNSRMNKNDLHLKCR